MQGYMVRNSPYRRSFGLDISGVVKTPHEEDLEAVADHPSTLNPNPLTLNTKP